MPLIEQLSGSVAPLGSVERLSGELMQRAHRLDAVASLVVDFRILGPVEVLSGGRRVAIEGRRTRVLLAMLLVWRNQTVSLDALIDGLWPQGPPSSAKGSLHAYVSRLRRSLAAAGPLPGGERLKAQAARL